MLNEELLARRLHADVSEVEINRRLLEIYREAKLSIEETGPTRSTLPLGFCHGTRQQHHLNGGWLRSS